MTGTSTLAHDKSLRVLTGLHAGASMRLPPGRHRLGLGACDSPEEAEAEHVSLLDWQGPALTLHIDPAGGAAGGVRLYPEDSAGLDDCGQASAAIERWADLQPRRLGGLVLCIGEADAPWPSDEDLLTRWRASATDRAANGVGPQAQVAAGADVDAPGSRRAQHSRGRYAATGVGVGLLLAVSTLFGGQGAPASSRLSAPRLGASELQRTLNAQGLTELTVRQADNGLVVEGLVRDAQQDTLAQQLIAPWRAGDLHGQWAIADDLAATIDAALRAPAVRTRYLGEGRFVSEGSADSPERVQASAAQVHRDLGANLRELTVNVAAIRRTAPVMSAVAAGGLRYDERRDGIKRFGTEQP